MLTCDFFLINYGHLDQAMSTADELRRAGAGACVLSVLGSPNDDHAHYQSSCNLLTYPPGHFYGHLWNEALRLCNAEVLGIITSDVRIADIGRLLARLQNTLSTFDNVWCYAPNVDYTPWRYRLHSLRRLSADLYHVPTTDGICWFLRSELAMSIGPLPLEVNYLGWGVDILAGITCADARKWVVRDYGLTVQHPAHSGYSREEAARQELQMAEYLGIAARYQDYLRQAQSQVAERSWRYPHGAPVHVQQRIRPRLRRSDML